MVTGWVDLVIGNLPHYTEIPKSNIDDNKVYLIPQEYDGGGGGGGGGISYAISRSGDTITLTGTDGSTSSVDGGMTSTEAQTLIEDTIEDVLGRAY